MHVGVIPDGNRRFMKKNGVPDLGQSYLMGINKFYDFLEWCIDLGVNEVTVYALSIENLQNRGELEIRTLLTLFSAQAGDITTSRRIHENKIKVNVCGNRDYLRDAGGKGTGQELLADLGKLEEATKCYEGLVLNLAIGYGGRQEIISALKALVDGRQEINEENVKKNLWVKSYPDIILRTAENRLSNFLTWQSAYSEIFFVDKLWQEFEKKDLEEILEKYGSRERRFGK